MPEIIDDVIEQSWCKFNPKLTTVCLHIINHLKKYPFPEKSHGGFNKCWLFMQILHAVNFEIPLGGLPYYWYKDGVVVDPATLTKVTGGRIRFKWDEKECRGCQIETECPCEGNPHHRGV